MEVWFNDPIEKIQDCLKCTRPECNNCIGRRRLPVDGRLKPVVMCDKLSGEPIATFESATDAEAETGVKRYTIYHCLRGSTKTAGGFIWKYKDEEDS